MFEYLKLGGTPLPRALRAFLEVDRAGDAVTFRQVVAASEAGLHRRDLPLNDEATRRIAASRVSKWLDTLVLPMQDILVDAPHLVARFPSLLGADRHSGAAWNAAASILAAPAPRFADRSIAATKYPLIDWLSRPAWFWHQLSSNQDIDEVRDPWSRADVDLVFCEDVSAFVPIAMAREFVASVEGPFSRRFVIDPGADGAEPWRDSVSGVNYRPPSNLAR